MNRKFRQSNKRELIYQIIKTYIIFFFLLLFLDWISAGSIGFKFNALFALLMTGGILGPILLVLKIIPDEINQKTVEERRKIFKEKHVSIKLLLLITACTLIFFLLLRNMVPVFGLTFGQALGVGLGIGLLFATLCVLAVWLIIGLDKPPFKK